MTALQLKPSAPSAVGENDVRPISHFDCPFWGESDLPRHLGTKARIEPVNERRHDGEQRA
jgi:hypothetical protein